MKVQRSIKFILENETATAILVFIILLPIVFALDRIFSISFKEILGNINGSLFDLMLFGVIFVIFNRHREKNRKISEYVELIEDFRDWRSDEAKFRILGAIKRLQNLAVEVIDLNRCNLESVTIENMNFRDSDFNCVNFSNVVISDCTFTNCNFTGAHLTYANISDCHFVNCDIDSANFYQANIFRTNFAGSNLKTCSVKNNAHNINIFYACLNVDQEFINAATELSLKIFEIPDNEKINRLRFRNTP